MILPRLRRIGLLEFLAADRLLHLDNMLFRRLKQSVKLEQRVSKSSGLRLFLPVIDPSASFHPESQAIKAEQDQDSSEHDEGPSEHVVNLRPRHQSRKRT